MSVEINVTDQIVEIEVAAGASVQPTWGAITGTLSNQTDLQNALDAKVPYSGATGNVNLGEYELKAGQLTFDTSPTGTATVATMRWNDTTGLAETTLKGGNVVLKNGVDLVARVVNKVSPNTTLTKAAYQAVRVSGAQGQRLAIELAQANNDNNSADTIGLVTETIATNQEGFIMTVGQLEGINTTGSLQGETWVDGDVLYLSPTTAGALTNVKPVAPQHLVIIGYVEYAHANNGKIYVKVMNSWELGELHDVNTTGATNGSVLKYNGSIWVPSSDIDTGITTLNTLTALSQTFATGTSGTDFNISSATSTHTFNLPSASAANRGLLTSADWTTFNNKQNALTNPVTGTGTSGQVAYWSGTNTQTGSNNLFWDAANNRLGIGTASPQTNIQISDNKNGITSLQISNTTAGISSQSGVRLDSDASAGTMNIGKYSSTTSSYLSISSRDGYLSNASFGDITIQNEVATGRIKFSGGGASTSQMTLFSTGNFGIGVGLTDGGQRLQVGGTLNVTGASTFGGNMALTLNQNANTSFTVTNTTVGNQSVAEVVLQSNTVAAFGKANSGYSPYKTILASDFYIYNAGAGDITLLNNFASGSIKFAAGGSSTAQLTLNSSGNLGLGTATPNDQLEISGNVASFLRLRISNANASGSQALFFTQGATAKAYIEYSNSTNNFDIWQFTNNALRFGTNNTERMLILPSGFVGIGTSTPNDQLEVAGNTASAFRLRINNANASGTGTLIFTQGTTLKSWVEYSNSTSNFDVWQFTNGALRFATNNTERMRLDASGNLGLGVTPSAWGSNSKPLQMADASIWGSSSLTGYASVGGNYFYDGNYKYIKSSTATDYYQYAGEHVWRNAVSGTAGNIITFVQRMTLDASGRLGIGITPSAANLTVYSTINDAPSTTNKGAFQIAFSTTNGLSFGTYSTSPFANYIQSIAHAQTAGSIYPLSLNPIGGAVLIGATTSTGESLQVNGTMKVTGASTFARITATTSGIDLDYNSGILYHIGGSGNYYQYISGASYTFRNRTATGSLIFATQDITRLTIDSAGAATFSSSVTSTQFRLSALNTAPATASSTGTLGEIRIDADYIYICTATNTWKRVAIATW